MIRLRDAHKIFTAPVEKLVYRAPNSEACMQISALCLELLLEIPPKARLHSCCSMEDVMDMALTARSNPKA